MNHPGKNTIQLTEGDIFPNLIRFALPVLMGQLLQTLYNSVDSVVVGQFVGTNGLAAVTASSTITQFFVGFFLGMSTGASVLLANCFGAKQYERLKRVIHTAITFSIVLGSMVACLGALFSGQILSAVSCPESIFDDALIYLRIYMGGALLMTLYNMGAATLRSVGDSRRPFIYLVVSSCMNIVLDILFVACFHMGVTGVALATVIAQFTSVILTFRQLILLDSRYCFSFRNMKIEGKILKDIIRLGLPAGIQSGITSLSSIYLQHYINSFSSAAIAGIGSAMRIDQFAGMPCNAMGLAMTTYIGQNMGAGKPKRAFQGVRIAFVFMLIMVTVVGIPAYFFSEQLLMIFSSDPEVIAFGVGMLHVILPLYFFMGFQQLFGGVIRGFGYSQITMFMVIGGMVGVRQVWVAVMLHLDHSIKWIYWGYPIGWAATACSMLIFYLFIICRKNKN